MNQRIKGSDSLILKTEISKLKSPIINESDPLICMAVAEGWKHGNDRFVPEPHELRYLSPDFAVFIYMIAEAVDL